MTKNIKRKNNPKFVAALIICLVASLVSYWIGYESVECNFPSEFALHWACMDGCYDMLEVEYGEFDYNNDEMRNLHENCSDLCWERFGEGVLEEIKSAR